jgi:hypothetical protein
MDQDHYDAVANALFSAGRPKHERAERLLMVLFFTESAAEDPTLDFQPLWDVAQDVVHLLDCAIVERDEARQQLAEARDQLEKIGRKAFWARREHAVKITRE